MGATRFAMVPHVEKFPFQAIRKAVELGEYTLTDRGTWCVIELAVRDKLTIFVGYTQHHAKCTCNSAILPLSFSVYKCKAKHLCILP